MHIYICMYMYLAITTCQLGCAPTLGLDRCNVVLHSYVCWFPFTPQTTSIYFISTIQMIVVN